MTLFDAKSQSLIKAISLDRKIQTQIQVITTGHIEDSRFISLSGELSALIPAVSIRQEKKEDGLPGLQLNGNIMFSALPFEKELEPFLKALLHLSGKGPVLPEGLQKALVQISIPVRLTLFIALHCPFCPKVVETVLSLALNCPKIHLHIIDGTLFPEAAEKQGVMSAPCLILEDEFRWTGQVSDEEILNMIIHRDVSRLSAGTLQTILEKGEAGWIARQMTARNMIFDGFVALLLNDTWSVRLGAMVIVEELCDLAPDLCATLCPILMERFDGTQIPVKGDILYILGLAGNKIEAEWIRQKMDTLEHQDLKDAAKDAMDTLEEKMK